MGQLDNKAYNPKESWEQRTFFKVLKIKYPNISYVAHHIPNGGLRHRNVAYKLKAEGVKAGVPDIFIPIPSIDEDRCVYHGLYIEMKRRKASYLTKEQKVFSRMLIDLGYYMCVARGWEEAIEAVESYFRLKDFDYNEEDCLDAVLSDVASNVRGETILCEEVFKNI